MFRSSTLRLAALYTAIFAVAVIVLGALTLVSLRAGLSEMFDAAIRNEALALKIEYQTEGRDAVLYAVRDRDQTLLHHYYGLEGPDGRVLAGRLAGRRIPIGWSQINVPSGDITDHVRTFSVDVGGGHRVIVGDAIDRVEQLDGDILRGFVGALLAVVLAGGAGGYLLSRGVHRRLNAIAGTAIAISDGDLARRVPVGNGRDDLDRLAMTLNRMLDRISVLMESLRQVSNDIAHDLRTPLGRVRQHLEAGLASRDPDHQSAALEGALADVDGVLATFSALLRIAEIEGGARRAAFTRVDLQGVCAEVVETFRPSAEDDGRTLSLAPGQPAFIEGDGELLTQMIVNLVENALLHTPVGARIHVGAETLDGALCLVVADDGPGIPPEERGRVLQRFYRSETSRSTPGSGLGLALVAAIARLHGGEVRLEDARPGLVVRVVFAD